MTDDLQVRLSKLQRINEVLIDRIETLDARRGSASSMFQAAVALEKEVLTRTRDLERALDDLGHRNRELALARAAAEEANRSKTRFLRAASHDLLQPLAAAKLFLGALNDTQMTAMQRELSEQLTSALQSIDELMQAVLEISRLDSQRIEFNRQPVALADLFARLGREHAPQAAAKRLKLVFATTTAVVDSDPTFLRRITQNLVSNAIKYTARGGVLVGARSRGSRIWLEVHDSGRGIPEVDRGLIFKEFHRGNVDAEEPGTGLGLAIVRRACAKLGHPLEFCSKVGRGTTFRVSLPRIEGAPLPTQPGTAAAVRRTLRGSAAILIENDPAMQRAYAMLLRDATGMKVHTVGSTAEAKILITSRPTLAADVILADYHLDSGDTGLVAIAALRELLGSVPAVMVTAHDSPEIARACLDLGVPLLRKPVTAEELRRALEDAISVQHPELRLSAEAAPE